MPLPPSDTDRSNVPVDRTSKRPHSWSETKGSALPRSRSIGLSNDEHVARRIGSDTVRPFRALSKDLLPFDAAVHRQPRDETLVPAAACLACRRRLGSGADQVNSALRAGCRIGKLNVIGKPRCPAKRRQTIRALNSRKCDTRKDPSHEVAVARMSPHDPSTGRGVGLAGTCGSAPAPCRSNS